MVLVVEDDESIQHLTQLALEAQGYKVLSAHDGRQGIELFLQHAADIKVVLLDLTMPNLSGVDTLKLLREQRADLPVLIMSGFSNQEIPQEYRQESSTAFLQKPFTLAALRAALQDLLDRQ